MARRSSRWMTPGQYNASVVVLAEAERAIHDQERHRQEDCRAVWDLPAAGRVLFVQGRAGQRGGIMSLGFPIASPALVDVG